ncbi:hypothetical protein QUC31_012224 [Theobroma cacao]
MASKQATVAFAALIICLLLFLGIGVSGQTCYYIEENCRVNADCTKICSNQGYESGAICVPNNTGSTHCCCVIDS